MRNGKLLFFIIVIFVIGGLAGFYLNKNKPVPDNNVMKVTQNSATTTPNSQTEEDDGNQTGTINTTNSNPISDWKSYSFGGVTFQYPPDWDLRKDTYCTPAGQCDQVGVTLMPRNESPNEPRAEEDKIGVGGRQVICAQFSNSNIKCTEPIDSLPFYTASRNPDILAVYYKVVTSVSVN
jgi:hypothetical protein